MAKHNLWSSAMCSLPPSLFVVIFSWIFPRFKFLATHLSSFSLVNRSNSHIPNSHLHFKYVDFPFFEFSFIFLASLFFLFSLVEFWLLIRLFMFSFYFQECRNQQDCSLWYYCYKLIEFDCFFFFGVVYNTRAWNQGDACNLIRFVSCVCAWYLAETILFRWANGRRVVSINWVNLI